MSEIDFPYAEVWCDSPRGLISFTVIPPSGVPIAYPGPPDGSVEVETKDQLFDILVKRDGTRVSFPYHLLSDYLGWTNT